MILYFSGTGNTQWVAQQMAQLTSDRVMSLSQHMLYPEEYPIELGKDEPLGLFFPVYGWAPPAIVMDFLRKTQIPTPPYIYSVVTMGDDIGRTRQILQSVMKQIRWPLDAMFSVRMPDCYICLPGFDVDSDEERTQKLQACQAQVLSISEQVLEQRRANFLVREGYLPRTKSYVLGGFFRKFLMDVEPFHSTDACTSCGACAKACPVENIQMVEGRPQWRNHCEMCLSCYHHCPHHAVQYGSRTKGKGQYLLSKYIKKNA